MEKSTRELILDKCFNAVSQKGFIALRTDIEIKKLGVTKGAFYHYFEGKNAVGLALVNERIKPYYLDLWKDVLHHSDIKATYFDLLEKEKRRVNAQGVNDILCSMAAESDLYDTDMREALAEFTNDFLREIQSAIRSAKTHGKVVQSGDSRSQSMQLLNGMMSCFLIAKVQGSTETFASSCKALYTGLEASFFSDDAAMPFA